MLMMRSWLNCCLLELIHVFNLTQGSVDRIQYRNKSTARDARMITTCVKQVTSALFEPSNRIVMIVSKNFVTNDSILTDNILRNLSSDMNAVTVGTNFDFQSEYVNPRRFSINRDASYLIMDDNSENLYRTFQSDELSIWAEYLIVTTLNVDTLEILTASIRRRGFLRFAFLHIEQKISKMLTLYDSEMKILTTFEDDNGNLRINKFTKRIRAFSNFLCPAKGCRFTVGLVKNDMIGSTKVAESRRVIETGDHVVSFFVEKLTIELKNRSLNNWTEALDAIVHGKVDMIYGNFIPRTEGLELLDVATWFSFEKVIFFDLVYFIRLAPITKIFSPLDIYVWICTLSCLVIYWLFTLIVQKLHEKKMIRDTIKIFNIWAILLGQGVRNPYNRGLRCVLSMWMMTALLINAAYGSAFQSSLSTFVKLTPLDTLDDVNNSGRRIVGAAVARQLFRKSNDKSDRLIYKKFKIVPPEEVFPVAIKDYNVGVDYDLNVNVHNLLKRERRTRLYILKEPILVFPLNFYMKKRHPYLKTFRQVVIRARAAGLIQKWNLDNFQSMQLRSSLFGRRYKWKKTARLRHWIVSFKLWGAGIGVALIRFLYELYKCRRDSLKKLTKDRSSIVDPINDFKITKDIRQIWNIFVTRIRDSKYSPATNIT